MLDRRMQSGNRQVRQVKRWAQGRESRLIKREKLKQQVSDLKCCEVTWWRGDGTYMYVMFFTLHTWIPNSKKEFIVLHLSVYMFI
jgi:hypothetical protein